MQAIISAADGPTWRLDLRRSQDRDSDPAPTHTQCGLVEGLLSPFGLVTGTACLWRENIDQASYKDIGGCHDVQTATQGLVRGSFRV